MSFCWKSDFATPSEKWQSGDGWERGRKRMFSEGCLFWHRRVKYEIHSFSYFHFWLHEPQTHKQPKQKMIIWSSSCSWTMENKRKKMESNLLMSISYSCMQNLLKIENPYHTPGKLMECLLPGTLFRDLVSRFELTWSGFIGDIWQAEAGFDLEISKTT